MYTIILRLIKYGMKLIRASDKVAELSRHDGVILEKPRASVIVTIIYMFSILYWPAVCCIFFLKAVDLL